MPEMINWAGYPEQIQVALLPRHVRIRQQNLTQIYRIIYLGPQNVSVDFLCRWEINSTNTNIFHVIQGKLWILPSLLFNYFYLLQEFTDTCDVNRIHLVVTRSFRGSFEIQNQKSIDLFKRKLLPSTDNKLFSDNRIS
jgi:hypothetical protein